jgi:hypothetical protein
MHENYTANTRIKPLLAKELHDMHGFRYSLSLSLLLLLETYNSSGTRANVQIQWWRMFQSTQDRAQPCIFVFYNMFI